jgi:HEAT repeat protein
MRVLIISPAILLSATLALPASAQTQSVQLPGTRTLTASLAARQTVEIYAGLPAPSQLPPNGRVAVEWAGYRKVLHALDPDFYMVYRAPQTGTYTLKVSVVEDEEAIFNEPRWREIGAIQKIWRFPKQTPWPAGQTTQLQYRITPVDFGRSRRGMIVEVEPNDSIAQAQPIVLGASGSDETWQITGGADDIEYFDNGKIGQAGDDWFRIEYKGAEPRLFTANLTLPDPFVVAQLLCYTADGKEYREGANENERVHQQLEGHRTAITRIFKPGGVYYLRVEANSPGYEVELRIRKPAPHTDPREAVRAAMYDHLGQVHAWLLNRPRGAAVDRRIRDTGSLLGTHCMSCHTQSGVWGPAGPMMHGYRVENVANLRQLINIMYESLRPTNELAEAANNTSLPPLDLGDGPAGTRVAGYNVATIEKVVAARRLHAAQQQRTANFVLQSNDPSGVNAAGPGSNVGQAVVYRFTGEILWRAYQDTGNEKYLKALEEKAERMLQINVRYSDDLSNRIEFFKRVFPQDYVKLRGEAEEAQSLWTRAMAQIEVDEKRLRQTQRPDGMWGFDPGSTTDLGRTWKVTITDPKDIDPAPTALALTALAALGYDDRDPAIARGVKALLERQDSYGRWNNNALTGFVTTAYVMHALARLYPVNDPKPARADFEPKPGESLSDTIARFRALAQLGLSADDDRFLDLVLEGASHSSPQVRYWAQIALGALHNERGVEAQIRGLGDPVKMVREAARWGMRQTLLDDKGWDLLYPAYERGDDLTREAMAGALVMRADCVMTRSAVNLRRLAGLLDHMMNRDPSPAVRAWASRAAWNWWVWNPPVRERLNEAVITMLEREEPNFLTEQAQLYQAEALFIANGQKANPSREHQYPQLAKLFAALKQRVEGNPSARLIHRLTAIAGTYYSQSGGDGGPGQMGYVTPHSAEMMGRAVLAYWQDAEQDNDIQRVRFALEAAANITYDPLQKKLLDYSSSGPEELRTIAATSLADPRIVTLPGTQEFLEPLMEQFYRAAAVPERRAELAGPILKLFSRARWNLPKTEEQQRIFYDLIVPHFPEERGKLEENLRMPVQMEKDSNDWYVARSLAGVVHSNPDLHTPALVRRVPERFATVMDEAFWLPSLRWLIHFGTGVPEVGRQPAPPAEVAPALDRIASLYVKTLGGNVDRRLHDSAINLSGDPIIRRHPKIQPVLAKVKPEYYEDEPAEVASMSASWRRNWEYFRDYVAPELARPNREDEMACLGCHAVPGRVPSMELRPADRLGYMKPDDLYANYRILMERIHDANVESSKLLRKPLNVQSGQEDGHQGGVRYNPNDRGYQILRRWAHDVAALRSNRQLAAE